MWPTFYFPAAAGNTSTAIIHESNKYIFNFCLSHLHRYNKSFQKPAQILILFSIFIALCDLMYIASQNVGPPKKQMEVYNRVLRTCLTSAMVMMEAQFMRPLCSLPAFCQIERNIRGTLQLKENTQWTCWRMTKLWCSRNLGSLVGVELENCLP